ncbi:tol-pal system protein YbgF [Rubricella aquisinus]|uniref:Cell division coordinator CpoB n=1 Tax=Rubricella aquisinus TaxID=2028108 RepID=A0A840X269_9RHOB|nr:tol-pal system protein YbgF [Rubricella aquisinus]MBB5515956.1 tol-pal system protein YbgF [Rubricella aquisinus]
MRLKLPFAIACVTALSFGAVTAQSQTPAPAPAATPAGTDPLPDVLPADPVVEMSLEDIRRELISLGEVLEDLRNELRPSGQFAPSTGTPPDPSLLARLDGLEARLREATGRMETLRFDLERIADDGGRRLSDLDFRVTMMEGADPSFVPPATPLGGGVTAPTETPGLATGAAQTAVSEQADFDRALAAFNQGNFAQAVQGFSSFLELYGEGPLSADARYWLAESQFGNAQYQPAAMGFLGIFSGAPNGERAPEALLKLGGALARLGQTEEACLTFDEALARFGNAQGESFIVRAQTEKGLHGCP